MKSLQTTLKGWLTNISLTTIIAGMSALQNDLIPAFVEASGITPEGVIIAGALGALWGLVRRALPAYKSK